MRVALPLRQSRRTLLLLLPPSTRSLTTSRPLSEEPRRQVWEGYLPDTLDAPLHSLPNSKPLLPPSSSSLLSTPSFPSSTEEESSRSSTEDEERLKRIQIVFGSKLAGPASRPPPHLDPRSQLIAGVHVPPKPEEPDNCCMSGCAHCVWDQWREEMEVWSGKSREAERALTAAKKEGGGGQVEGREEDRVEKDEELFKDVPVGIREFMKIEKKLRERRGREG